MADHRSAARVDHVGLTVLDLDAVSAWYCGAFGLVVEARLRVEPFDLDIVMLRSPQGGGRVELLRRGSTTPAPAPSDPAEAAARTGFGHLAFDVVGVDAEFARLITMGARAVMSPGPSPEPDVRMAFLGDPEGNLIELLDRTAGTAQARTSR